MNLVALELGAFLRCGIDNDAAVRMDFRRDHEAFFDRMAKEALHHVDDVVERVVVVIVKNDVVRRQLLGLLVALRARAHDRFWNGDTIGHCNAL